MSSSMFHVTEHIIPSQHIREYPGAVRENQEDVLQLHVRQYVPRQIDATLPAITVIGTHGNGFPKEASEALWDELLSRAHANGFSIGRVWIADATHQGQSYVLNEDKLSDDPSWLDHSRDLLYMTNHFRSEMKRPIFGVGHSMGGAQLIHLAVMHPRLLTGIVLLDPIVQPDQLGVKPDKKPYLNLVQLSTYRRDQWPSRVEAAKAIRKAPMFASWDDRAWDAFVRYGLRDLPTKVYPELPEGSTATDPPVTLTTPVQQEVHTFLRANFRGKDIHGNLLIDRRTHADVDVKEDSYPFYKPEPLIAWRDLPYLRPSALFVLASESKETQTAGKYAPAITGTGVGGSGGEPEGRVKSVILDGISHGIPFEAPVQTAEHSAKWIGEEVRRWKAEQGGWLNERRRMAPRDHLVPSEEWKKHVGPPPTRRRNSKVQSKM